MAIISGVTISGGGVTIAGGGAPATDPYFMYNSLLLPGNGTNTAQNNTFLDGSTNNFSITRNGNTTQGTFSPYGSNWSAYLNGSACTTAPANTALDVGLSGADFTIEAWVNPTDTQGIYGGAIVSKGIAGVIGNDVYSLQLNAVSGGNITVGSGRYVSFLTASGGSNVLQLLSPTQLPVNAWSHVAVTRSSGTNTLWINGISVASNSNSYSISAGGPTTIGCQWYSLGDTNRTLNGYVSNARIVKGTAVYTSTFTPSTTPLTAISGTGLLTCQSNRFIDNSTNAFAITLTGSPSIQRFSPFSPTQAYDTSTIGGSGYFDGTGDYLTLPAGNSWLFTGDHCLEAWVYWTVSQASVIYATGNASSADQFGLFPGGEGIWWGATSQSSAVVPTLNAWNHVCVTRQGTTIRRFLNGQLITTSTVSGNIGSNSATPYIGRRPSSGVDFTGNMGALRIINGSVPTSYQTSSTTINAQIFTPPTAPLTTTSQGATSGDVKLLLSYTNAGIIDNAMMNNLETVGNAQISTTQSKFGGGSMYFDGTGDYLLSNSPSTQLYSYGGDFTIELWLYRNATGQTLLVDSRPTGGGGASAYYALYVNTSNIASWIIGNTVRITGTTTISNSTWYHIAVSRSGSSTKLFVNGTQEGSTYTDSTSLICATSRPYVGIDANDGNWALNGYIDDLRITKGYARYTTTFTPPTTAFPLN